LLSPTINKEPIVYDAQLATQLYSKLGHADLVSALWLEFISWTVCAKLQVCV